MNIFFDVNDTAINLGKVKEIGRASEKAIRISFDDGASEVYDVEDSAEAAAERFGKFIVQIIPCNAPYYNVYANDDGSYIHERVHFLVMCADGYIRSLSEPCCYMYLADESENYIGIYNEAQLAKYPTSVNGE